MGSSRLTLHQRGEARCVPPGPEIVLAHVEGAQIRPRQIDAPGRGVAAHVAQNVRELQGEAQVDSVVAGATVRVAEDLDGGQSHGRGDPVAVREEVLDRLVAHAVEIHGDAVDDGLQGFAGNRELPHGLGQPLGDGLVRRAPRLVTARHLPPPVLELGLRLRAIHAALLAQVGDVVYGPAEGVHGVERVAARPGQREEREVEVGAAPPRETRDEVGRRHRATMARWGSPWTYPCSTNHATASASACRGSVWGNPSSRTALAALKYMRLRAMRTAVSGTAGAPRVSRAAPSEPTAASQATA